MEFKQMEMDDNKRRRNMILYVLIAFVVYLALMALPNLCSLLLLSSEAARLTRDYFARERVLHG